jgi:hypothetical protein
MLTLIWTRSSHHNYRPTKSSPFYAVNILLAAFTTTWVSSHVRCIHSRSTFWNQYNAPTTASFRKTNDGLLGYGLLLAVWYRCIYCISVNFDIIICNWNRSYVYVISFSKLLTNRNAFHFNASFTTWVEVGVWPLCYVNKSTNFVYYLRDDSVTYSF